MVPRTTPEHGGQAEGQGGEGERGREALGDRLGDGPAEQDGLAEVPAEEAPRTSGRSRTRNGRVEAELLADPLDLVGRGADPGHHHRRVARHHVHDAERDEGDEEQDDDRRQSRRAT